jgi:hypothetical protein
VGFQSLMIMKLKGWEDGRLTAVVFSKVGNTLYTRTLYFSFQFIAVENMNITVIWQILASVLMISANSVFHPSHPGQF